jgi:site-specific DNA recombinase
VNRDEHDSVQARAHANVRSRQAVPAGQAPPTAKTEYLYRGLLHCGICGLRMWGNHKRQSTYYSCQPGHQRSKNVPAEHPPSVYLNEKRLNEALFCFLTSALFGADRIGYWTRALDDAADPDRVAPAGARLAEIQDELADLERRLGRQLLNLEAEETTPTLRKRIAVRVAELEDTITDRQQRARELAEQADSEAPTLVDVAPLLDRLPILAGALTETPPRALRAWFDALQLEITYQPGDQTLDVALTLCDNISDHVARQEMSEDWSVPPAGFEPALSPPEGDALSPELRGQQGLRRLSHPNAGAFRSAYPLRLTYAA